MLCDNCKTEKTVGKIDYNGKRLSVCEPCLVILQECGGKTVVEPKPEIKLEDIL